MHRPPSRDFFHRVPFLLLHLCTVELRPPSVRLSPYSPGAERNANALPSQGRRAPVTPTQRVGAGRIICPEKQVSNMLPIQPERACADWREALISTRLTDMPHRPRLATGIPHFCPRPNGLRSRTLSGYRFGTPVAALALSGFTIVKGRCGH